MIHIGVKMFCMPKISFSEHFKNKKRQRLDVLAIVVGLEVLNNIGMVEFV